MIRLSVCIATFNRAPFLPQTLETIIHQLGPETELVIVDGASSDETSAVLAAYRGLPDIRCFSEPTNSGIDRDYDKAVNYARGHYCWLMTDDDLLVPGAVERVLKELADEPDVIVVDAEVRDLALQRVLEPRRLLIDGSRDFYTDDRDQFLALAGNALTFIGGTIVRRQFWMERDRATFFGTLFIHAGIIFQLPAFTHARILDAALVRIRQGNAMWTARSFEIWMFLWPKLIWGFGGYSDFAKLAVTPLEPWRDIRRLLLMRAAGSYAVTEYRTFFSQRRVGLWRLVLWCVAHIPGRAANVFALAYLSIRGKGRGTAAYNLMHSSRFSRAAIQRTMTPASVAGES